MAAAARAGDATSHGTPLNGVGGSPNVRIGGQAAWRVGMDVSICSLSDGPKPHGGGVVVPTRFKVFINKVPAACQGDNIVETSPATNSITGGCEKVQIGG